MKRKWLAVGISITAVILITLTSFSNVVGYQAFQTSQQNLIKEKTSQRELLFQTIVDIANNNKIQRIILKSQMSRGIIPASDIPVITKHQLKQMFLIGIILSKFMSKSRMQSMVRQNQFINLEIQQEISTVIEKDSTLKGEITQLQNAECDCENENISIYHFPIICYVLIIIFFSIIFLSYGVPDAILWAVWEFYIMLLDGIYSIGGILNCEWLDWTIPYHLEGI